MKKIEAVIRPSKLEELKSALNSAEVSGMTVFNVMGKGQQQDIKHFYRGQELCVDLFPKSKVEIVCHDHKVKDIVEIILKVCQTGQIGDGKIFVYPIEEIIRISTGERDEEAL